MTKRMTPADLSKFEDWFKSAEEATVKPRAEAERARDYQMGIQLTEGERQELARRKQPPVVNNRIRRKIDFLVGLEIKQRTDPRAFPRTPEHQQGAEAATDAIRFVCDNEDWDEVRTLCYEHMLVEGFCGAEVVHEKTPRGETKVAINYYPWDRLFYDPHSRMHDFSDARYKGVVMWMDESDFKDEFGDDAADHASNMFSTSEGDDTYGDRPNDMWVDRGRRRVRVILLWYRKKRTWCWAQFVKGMLLASGESPYMDDEGESTCPLIMQSTYIDRDNGRHGIIRDMFDPQDEINKRRSKALHLLTMRQLKMPKSAGDAETFRMELAKPDGIIAYDDGFGDQVEVLRTDDMAQGNLALLQEAKAEIDLQGANSALAGETGESTSGRAVLARQQGGMIEIAFIQDKLHQFTREVYRQIWMRIRQFWTEERWIRVTDEERNARFVGLNQPITLEQYLGQMDEQEAAQIAMRLGLTPNDPRLSTVVGIDNNVAELDVDIIIEEVPDKVTLLDETFEALLKYAQNGQIPPEVLIEADPGLPVKRKEKLLEMLQAVKAQPAPQEQMKLAEAEANISKTMAEAQKIAAETGMPVAAYPAA